jgi:hypothetical protein
MFTPAERYERPEAGGAVSGNEDGDFGSTVLMHGFYILMGRTIKSFA